MKRFTFKIAVLGNAYVGKTELLETFFERSTDSIYYPTLEPVIHPYRIQLDEAEVLINIWDIPSEKGIMDFHAKEWLQDTAVAILMYSINDQDSLDAIPYWYSLISQYAGSVIPVLIVANKTDLAPEDLWGTATVDKGKKLAMVIKKTLILEEDPFMIISALKDKDAYRVFNKAFHFIKKSQEKSISEEIRQAYRIVKASKSELAQTKKVEETSAVIDRVNELKRKPLDEMMVASDQDKQITVLIAYLTDIVTELNAIDEKNISAMTLASISEFIRTNRLIRDCIGRLEKETIIAILFSVNKDINLLKSESEFFILLLFYEFTTALTIMSFKPREVKIWAEELARFFHTDTISFDRFHSLPQPDQEKIITGVCYQTIPMDKLQAEIYSMYRKILYHSNI